MRDRRLPGESPGAERERDVPVTKHNRTIIQTAQHAKRRPFPLPMEERAARQVRHEALPQW